jgi:hypothetical protein
VIKLEPRLRVASEADASELAELVNFAGEGLPLYIWEGLAKDGQGPREIGRARQIEKAREGQIVVVGFGDGAVASLTGYPIGNKPKPIGDDFPACFGRFKNWKTRHWKAGMSTCWPAIPNTEGKDLAPDCSTLQNKLRGMRRFVG